MNDYQLIKVIGNAVREGRLKKDWSLTLLSKRSGYSKSMLSQLENGNNGVSIGGFLRIAKLLHLDIEEALGLNPWMMCRNCAGSGKVRK